MEWLVHTLRSYPEIAIFLTLAIGFWGGKLKVGTFSLGVVTSTLLAGVLIGQLKITISPNVKSTFFLMFLFAVGYSVGPQFFRGLKGDGFSQVLFAVMLCTACLLCAYLMARIMGYGAGLGAGLLSGACTISAVLGVATDSIHQLSFTAEQKQALINAMPVAYAVTYIYGTAGSAWFLSKVGPKLMRVNLAEECKKLESSMGLKTEEPGVVSAYQRFVARAYRAASGQFVGRTVAELEKHFAEQRLFVERIRQGGGLVDPEEGTIIAQDAVLAVAGRRDELLKEEASIGEEVDDPELLDFPGETLDVIVTNKAVAGNTLRELAEAHRGQDGRGVFLRRLVRAGREMPFTPGTRVDRGDVLRITGARRDVERAAARLGYADRATEKTDMIFMALGIVLGALLGAVTIRLGGVPLGLSTSGGALIAGLVCGWLRSVHPTFGRIPAPALWVFSNVGLNTFIAVVGIDAGPSFIAGLKADGPGLFLSGVVVTTLPFIIGIFAGKHLFKMHPGIVLGACAGARTTTAALGAIEEAAGSKVPALGYTITYAVGNTLFIIWGVVIVMLLK